MFGKTIRIDGDEVLGCIADMQQARLDYLENEDEEVLIRCVLLCVDRPYYYQSL